ncbi:MAG: UxaA family hydrolase [Dehalococcoidales bacterium]
MNQASQAKSCTKEIKGEAKNAIIMAMADSVAIALDDLIPGDRVSIRSLLQEIVSEFEVSDSVPYGHKLSVKTLAKGSEVIKNGEVIGIVSQAIRHGEHAHIHNIVSLYAPPPSVKRSRVRRNS